MSGLSWDNTVSKSCAAFRVLPAALPPGEGAELTMAAGAVAVAGTGANAKLGAGLEAALDTAADAALATRAGPIGAPRAATASVATALGQKCSITANNKAKAPKAAIATAAKILMCSPLWSAFGPNTSAAALSIMR
jgi:hypothetical protein